MKKQWHYKQISSHSVFYIVIKNWKNGIYEALQGNYYNSHAIKGEENLIKIAVYRTSSLRKAVLKARELNREPLDQNNKYKDSVFTIKWNTPELIMKYKASILKAIIL